MSGRFRTVISNNSLIDFCDWNFFEPNLINKFADELIIAYSTNKPITPKL